MSNRVALYARVSSEHQAQEGTIGSQIASLRAYCAEQGYIVEEDLIFIDNGVSGTTLARRGLDALRDKAVAGELDTVLVLCPDRLARKHTHQLLLVEEFHRLGVEILFANHTITSTPEDQLLFQMQGVIAEFEREKILERGRRGKLHRARSGKVSALAQAPYGYVYLRAMNRDETRYEIHPQEAEVVRELGVGRDERPHLRFAGQRDPGVGHGVVVGHGEPPFVLRSPLYDTRVEAVREPRLHGCVYLCQSVATRSPACGRGRPSPSAPSPRAR